MKRTLKFFALGVFFATLLSTSGAVGPITHLDLGGQWEVSASGSNDWFAATVPGCVHTDLLAAKRIPDPFYRDNEKHVQWISELAWTYRRTFQVTDNLLQREPCAVRRLTRTRWC